MGQGALHDKPHRNNTSQRSHKLDGKQDEAKNGQPHIFQERLWSGAERTISVMPSESIVQGVLHTQRAHGQNLVPRCLQLQGASLQQTALQAIVVGNQALLELSMFHRLRSLPFSSAPPPPSLCVFRFFLCPPLCLGIAFFPECGYGPETARPGQRQSSGRRLNILVNIHANTRTKQLNTICMFVMKR